ncbi:MAG: hypothetical protein IPK00_16950 [Deltaproteobacteria bacterium]|nr:hypothetical protein [Deltaproteobacteria bacterium]
MGRHRRVERAGPGRAAGDGAPARAGARRRARGHLGVAALRIDLLRTRYAVSTVMERENELIEEQRQLIVRRRQLRDPVALAVKARERGFRPPAHVVSLPDPTLGRVEDVVAPQPVIAHAAVAAVSAGPAADAPSTGDAWE